MKIIQFAPGQAPHSADVETPQATGGFFWVDVERTASDWQAVAQRWLGIDLDDRHLRDTLNAQHPPYYDGTDDYDLIDRAGLGSRESG